MPSPLLARIVLLVLAAALAKGGTASLVTGAAIPPAAQTDTEAMVGYVNDATAQPSLVGPLAGELTLAIGEIDSVVAGVDAVDFYATATFTQPYPPGEDHPWDIGFGFRQGGPDDELRLIVDSTDTWYLFDGPDRSLSTGQIEQSGLTTRSENTLALVAVGDRGYVALNGDVVTSLELPADPAGGDIWVGSGFFVEDVIVGETTPFSDFEVWSIGGATATPDAPSATAPAPPATTPAATPDTAIIPSIEPGAEGLAQAVASAVAQPSIVGPLAGDLIQTTGSATTISSSIDVQNFYTRARFINPADAESWDYGLAFRDQPSGEHYRLVIDATGAWAFSIGLEPDLASGSIQNFDSRSGGANEIELAVAGDTGAFAVNGEFVANLDTSRLMNSGSVWVGTAFAATNVTDGAVTRYEAFEVWPLTAGAPTPEPSPTETAPAAPTEPAVPPEQPTADDPAAAFDAARQRAQQQPSIAPATSGTMVEETERLVFEPAGVSVADFYATVEFVSPRDPAQFPWDVGIVFRATSENQYRLVLRSNGEWVFGLGSDQLIDLGQLPAFRTGINETNTLELVVIGDRGFFAVNGEFVAELNVSAHGSAGEIALSSAFFSADSLEGGTTRFQGFEVWSLESTPEPPVATAPVATPVPAATPIPTEAPPAAPTATPAATASAGIDGVDGKQLLIETRERALAQPAEAPLAGELVETAGQITFIPADISTSDFYARVRVQNPAGTEPWNYGLAFRVGTGDDYRLVLRSTGAWGLLRGSIADPSVTGEVPSLQLDPAAVNTLEVVALGDIGVFAVNGEVVATLDLSEITEPGDVRLASSFVTDDGVTGRTIRFRDFLVVPLDDAASPPSEPTATVAASPMATPTATPVPAVQAELEAILAEVRQQPPAALRQTGTLVDGGSRVVFDSVIVDARDVVVRAEVDNPRNPALSPFDIGFILRGSDQGQVRIIIRSNGEWALAQGVEPPIASGTVTNLRTDSGESNVIEIVAVEGDGLLVVNGEVAATLDLSIVTSPGGVALATALFMDDSVLGSLTTYRGFAVWTLDQETAPMATVGPAEQASFEAAGDEARQGTPVADLPSGELFENSDDQWFVAANIDARDVYATVDFEAPRGPGEGLWEVAFSLRDTDDGNFRLFIRSDDEWGLNHSSDGVTASLAVGTVPNLRTGAGELNTIELLATGETGYLAVNGELLAVLDLSADVAPGDIFFFTPNLSSEEIEAGTIRFQNFQVWSLDEPAVSSEEQAALAAILTEVEQQSPATSRPTGTLVETLNRITSDIAAVDARDIVVQAAIENPRDLSQEPFDFGIFFRESDDNFLQLTIRSSSEWVLASADGVISSGTVPNLETDAGSTNSVQLAAVAGAGLLVINDEVVATLDLSDVVTPGTVSLATGMYTDDTVDGATTTYRDFTVWTLDQAPGAAMGIATVDPETQNGFDAARDEARERPPLAAIATGELVDGTADQWYRGAGVDLQDFYAAVDFENPRGPGERPWEVSVSFRDTVGAVDPEEQAGATADDGFYQLFLRSDDEWTLLFNRAGTTTVIASGTVAGLRSGTGEINTVELLVTGATGLLAVNGTVVATLDLGGFVAPGDVYVNAHGLDPEGTETSITRFQNFQVWSLDDTTAAAASPVAGTPAIATPDAPIPAASPAAAPSPTATDAASTVVIDLLPIDTPAPTTDDGEQIALRLADRDGSGISGLAILTSVGETTRINLTLFDGSGDEIAVIHEGFCDDRSLEPAFLLPPPGPGGVIRATLPVALAELQSMPHSIDTHASDAEFSSLVACGNIGGDA